LPFDRAEADIFLMRSIRRYGTCEDVEERSAMGRREGVDMDSTLIARIKQAVDDGFDRQCAFLSDLVRIRSQRGEERRAQEFMATAYASDGYPIDMWKIDVEQIRSLPGFSSVAVSYDDAYNIVARHAPRVAIGRSLILNGYIDVVPTGPHEHWTRDPYEPAVLDGWM
jgi:acetylornithine deacetylase